MAVLPATYIAKGGHCYMLIGELPPLGAFAPGIAVLPVVEWSVSKHLEVAGSWRRLAFVELARELTGDTNILAEARWCHEALIAVTPDTH
ncbi:hypothetical protein SE17_40615, partial [Kouleothrix aurantiaca]